MATNKKTRKRTKAPAAEAQPAANAAPEPAPAVVRTDRPRFDPTIPPRDRSPRLPGPLVKTARLVRGKTYTLTYSDDPVYFFQPGPAVLITEIEFARLIEAVDKIDFQDPGQDTRTIRSIRKFVFTDSGTGKVIELPPLPDYQGGDFVLSAGDQAQRDALFEGAQHTRR